MRTNGNRKKKLAVAFHFRFANQAAWKCDSCRKQGLEKTRRCGWIEPEERGPVKLVWARKHVRVTECPQSLITGDSLAWLEAYEASRLLGQTNTSELPSRTVEALYVLAQEDALEARDDKQRVE